MTIRPMCETDLDPVLAIEKQSFASPWTKEAFEQELRKPFGICLVAEEEGAVLAYLVAWRVMDEVHIANLAVHPDRRRLGAAEALMRFLESRERSAVWMGLEVRKGNAAARSLYRKLGFFETGLRRRYYQAEGEDAILMSKVLPEQKK
ncbi:ribosomal protein S18-alanine N-acetyltransferase [bacterium]|nr:ribosomal protein S18-alanine N-acetyltransferase [bacterium]